MSRATRDKKLLKRKADEVRAHVLAQLKQVRFRESSYGTLVIDADVEPGLGRVWLSYDFLTMDELERFLVDVETAHRQIKQGRR